MAMMVRCSVDENGSFSTEERVDLGEGLLRPMVLHRPPQIEEPALPLGDFSHFWSSTHGVFVVSDRAWELVATQPGVLEVLQFLDVDGKPRRLVQVLLQLDLIDRGRSVASGFGPDSFDGIHLVESADSIAGVSLFVLPPPNCFKLFCGADWKHAYDSMGLTGLSFELAKVG
jgi:hypothetical protein